jgi:threonine/homoserine/homoserine lactone efflux protein
LRLPIILSYLFQAIGFGFASAVSPGTLQTLIINETLTHGWRRSLPIVFAPLISDIPVLALTLFILGQLPDSVLRIIQIAGGVFILYLAWGMFRELRAEIVTSNSDVSAPTAAGMLRKSVTLNLLNPMPYIFWGTIMGPIARQAWTESPIAAVAFMIGFYVTMIGMFALFVGIIHQARRLDDKFVRVLRGIAVVVMFALGMLVLKSGIFGA